MSITLYQNNDLLEIRDKGALIGYVEHHVLYGLNARGYSERIDEIEHRSEITNKLQMWRKENFNV